MAVLQIHLFRTPCMRIDEVSEAALYSGKAQTLLAYLAVASSQMHRTRSWGFRRALPYAWRLVEIDPWQERPHRQLNQLLALSGQREADLDSSGIFNYRSIKPQ